MPKIEKARNLEVAVLETERLSLLENSPKKAKLNANHKRFIKARLNGKSNADAYMEAYGLDDDKRVYARTAASRLMMTNDGVSEEISRRMDESLEEAQATLLIAMSEAASTISELAKTGTKEDGTRLRAAEYIIDRGLGKPRTDMNIEGNLKTESSVAFYFGDKLTGDDV